MVESNVIMVELVKIYKTVYKPAHEWDKLYRSKLSKRKKYKDISDMVAVEEEPKDIGESTKKPHKLCGFFVAL